ncbi:juvenile hormone esterase-like [Cylas formicarius]|uniref:juvenile hormone esterase-like n=1 Tax=Cylas formicarius TaxID=197179 RepID=UPI0029587826|nr:juvenile hormone esterase-like [Cylas formicarius]
MVVKTITFEMRVFLLLVLVSTAVADLVIDLPDGRIRGHEIRTESSSMYAFQGIPFGRPPVGKLRFQAPLPSEPWEGVLEANRTAASCIVVMHFDGDPEIDEQNEDCLYLNVYTPARQITEKLPVLFWIYGGGFIGGCASYDYYGPDDLVNEDVIIVTVNYRLGFYGFLSTEDKAILGNAGLKDQLLALKWAQKNIEFFGGDPEKITIFGESAGGISVGAHVVNSKSKGLFRAAICQSGCSLTTVLQSNARQNVYDLAKIFDPTISEKNTTTEIRDFLQSLPSDVLAQAGTELGLLLGAVVEVEDEDAFITKPAVPLLESGNFNQVPLIIGTVSEESIGFLPTISDIEEAARSYDADVTALLPVDLVPLEGANLTEAGIVIKDAYTDRDRTFSEDLSRTLKYFSDNIFGRPTLKQVKIQSNFTPVYLYQFSFAGTKSQNRTVIEGAGKVGHADELAYLFKISTFPLATEADFLTRKRMVKMWTNFAKTLNPTPDASDPILNVTWPSVSSIDIQYLDIDDTLQVKPNGKVKQMEMWDYVYETYGKRPFYYF